MVGGGGTSGQAPTENARYFGAAPTGRRGARASRGEIQGPGDPGPVRRRLRAESAATRSMPESIRRIMEAWPPIRHGRDPDQERPNGVSCGPRGIDFVGFVERAVDRIGRRTRPPEATEPSAESGAVACEGEPAIIVTAERGDDPCRDDRGRRPAASAINSGAGLDPRRLGAGRSGGAATRRRCLVS